MKKYFTIMLLCVVLSIFIIFLICNVKNNTDNDQTIRVEAPISTPETEYSLYELAIPYSYIENFKNKEDTPELIEIKSFFATEALSESDNNIDTINANIKSEFESDIVENTKKSETKNSIMQNINTVIKNISATKTNHNKNTDYKFKKGYYYYDINFDYEYQEYVQDICKEYNIDHKLVLALIGCESEYQPDVISKTHDYGLMQINKCNFEHLQEKFGKLDFLNPKDNILAGVYMLSLFKQYSTTTDELLMCYNFGVNGARSKWSQGIYSNAYTDKVHNRIDSLEQVNVN